MTLQPNLSDDTMRVLQLADDEFITLFEAGPDESATDFKPDDADLGSEGRWAEYITWFIETGERFREVFSMRVSTFCIDSYCGLFGSSAPI